jgi:hypothetical protein
MALEIIKDGHRTVSLSKFSIARRNKKDSPVTVRAEFQVSMPSGRKPDSLRVRVRYELDDLPSGQQTEQQLARHIVGLVTDSLKPP